MGPRSFGSAPGIWPPQGQGPPGQTAQGPAVLSAAGEAGTHMRADLLKSPVLGNTHLGVDRKKSHLCPCQSRVQRTSSEPRSPWR